VTRATCLRWSAVLALTYGLMLTWSGQADAACGPGKPRPYLVAAGTSLHGVPWRITARREGENPGGSDPFIAIDFKTVGYPQSGFGSALPLPVRIPPAFFSAIGGSYMDPPPESDFAGFTGKRVYSLVVRMQVGDSVTIYPQPAPPRLRRHICWLRHLKFFDGYFEGAPIPVEMTAYDATGKALGSKKPTGGSFF
jgi:hypothetical protein